MPDWIVRKNVKLSIVISAETADEAIEKAEGININNWDQAWSNIEAEKGEAVLGEDLAEFAEKAGCPMGSLQDGYEREEAAKIAGLLQAYARRKNRAVGVYMIWDYYDEAGPSGSSGLALVLNAGKERYYKDIVNPWCAYPEEVADCLEEVEGDIAESLVISQSLNPAALAEKMGWKKFNQSWVVASDNNVFVRMNQ